MILSVLKELIDFLIELSKLIIAGATIYGLIRATKLLNKKMNEVGVNSTLENIRKSNRSIRDQVLIVIDELKDYERSDLGKKEITEVAEKINNLYKASYDSNKEVVTYLHYTSNVLRTYASLIDEPFDPRNNRVLIAVDKILKEILKFTTKLVSIPHSIVTGNQDLVSNRIKPFLNDTSFQKYKYFDMGLIEDPISSHYLLLFVETNKVSPMFSIASCKFMNLSFHTLVYMYADSIYAPVNLKLRSNTTIVQHMVALRLVRVMSSMEYGSVIKEVVTLTYANVGSAKYKPGKNKLKDFYGNDFDKEIAFFNDYDYKEEAHDSFTIKVDKVQLQDMFIQYKPNSKRILAKRTRTKRWNENYVQYFN